MMRYAIKFISQPIPAPGALYRTYEEAQDAAIAILDEVMPGKWEFASHQHVERKQIIEKGSKVGEPILALIKAMPSEIERHLEETISNLQSALYEAERALDLASDQDNRPYEDSASGAEE